MSVIIVAEIVCFIVALVCLLKDTETAWRLMIVFLFITSATEICGKWLKDTNQHNTFLYNIYLIFEASFTSLLFHNIFSKYFNSKPLILSGLAFLLVLYLYGIYDHGFFVFNDLTATVMSVIFVVYSFYYYFLVVKEEQYLDLLRSAPFWWVAGSMLFYFGSTAVNVFFTSLYDAQVGGRNVTYFIFTGLSIILYGCWGYSFICKKWATTTRSKS